MFSKRKLFMKKTENYHYLALLFALSSIADNVSVKRDKNGEGMAQQPEYTFTSNDGQINFKIRLYTYCPDENPYKKEVYQLANYVQANNDFLKISKPIENDSELFENAAKLANGFTHWTSYKIRYSLSQERLNSIFQRLAEPVNYVYGWKQDVESTFIPMCREHIALITAGNLMVKDFLSLDQTSAVQMRKNINRSLFALGFAPEYVMEMYHSSKTMPPYEEPAPKTLN